MKYLRFSSIMVVASLFMVLYSQNTAQANISSMENISLNNQDSLNAQDAVILTLRMQEEIKLDTLLFNEITHVLQAVRNQYDTLKSIYAFPDYALNQLLLSSDASWTQAWHQGELLTGNQTIDSLTSAYQMISVEVHSSFFVLNFAQPLKMSLLSNIYEAIPGVIYAEPNGYIGDGDNIECFKKNNIWHLIFSRGFGDCPAGCIYRYYWYVTVDENLIVQLIDERERDFRVPYIYLWNIPPRYAATVFSGTDEILSTAQSASEWWIRRHAIEAIGRLFINEYPWVGEDLDNSALFESIRNGIVSNKQEVIEVLIQLLNDPDPDVRTSAQWALNKSLGLDGGTLAYYFPMHIGNQWSFYLRNPITNTIIDTMRINDRLYYQFDNIYFHMSSDNKLYSRSEDHEQLWLDFSAEVGDSWTVPDQPSLTVWTVFLQSKTDTITVPAGTFTNCYQFWFSFGCCDNDWVEWYAPGIGPVKRILYGFGIIEYPLGSAIINGLRYPIQTSIHEQSGERQPTQFALLQNYPNPFNPVTTIEFSILIKGLINLTVYDLTGREVETLVNKIMNAGTYTLEWNASNLPSGIYLITLSNGTYSKTQKALLLK
ncbi:MAG: T9SS type A sorting domain-containing protein [Candidatus Marinimicrobia bacterium]|nr:T9SS type A sorting domain-containing protein [Candidatus Neomarinimicrobiota bacterium]